MPTFRTTPSSNLTASIRRMLASGGAALDPLQEAQVDSMAASTAHNMSLAQKARAEVEAMQRSEAARNDPELTTQYAGDVAGIDSPDATRLFKAIRGVHERPMIENDDEGNRMPDVTFAKPDNLPAGAERMFRSALAAATANQLATGHTNAEQLAQAGGSINKTALTNQAANEPDPTVANPIIAAVAGHLRQPFKMGGQGQVLNQEAGTVNENTTLATAALNAERALAAQRGRGEDGGKPPSGYVWGPKNGQSLPTLVPIPGGPAAPAPSAGGGTLNGDAFLGSIPQEKAAQVKALAEGRMQFPGGFALKSPYWQDMLASVAQYDPSFDSVNYNARSKTRNAFVAGREGQSLNALNTVMGHMDDLEKAATALNNTDYPLLNKASNAVGGQMSPDLKGRLNAFKLNVQAVASEMERAYRGTGGNMAEIEEWKRAMDASDSPQAIRAGLRQATKLLGSKIDALGDQYSKGMGTTKSGLELLTPKAQATYNRLVTDRKGGGAAPAALPPVNAKGWKLMQDAKGNKAYVSPDGAQFEEAQ